jgi:acyl transferase domain-containing protein
MVFRYVASMKHPEEHTDTGTVVARDKDEAKKKLRAFRYDRITFKRLHGWSALVGKFTADVK